MMLVRCMVHRKDPIGDPKILARGDGCGGLDGVRHQQS